MLSKAPPPPSSNSTTNTATPTSPTIPPATPSSQIPITPPPTTTPPAIASTFSTSVPQPSTVAAVDLPSSLPRTFSASGKKWFGSNSEGNLNVPSNQRALSAQPSTTDRSAANKGFFLDKASRRSASPEVASAFLANSEISGASNGTVAADDGTQDPSKHVILESEVIRPSPPASKDHRKIIEDAAPLSEKAWWTAEALRAHPEIVDVLERVRPLSRAVSFGKLYAGQPKTAVKDDPLGGDVVMQLVLQHLQYEGLRQSKRALEEESGLRFGDYQLSESRLLTLLRMAIKDTEKVWELTLADERHRDSQQGLEEHLCSMGLLREDLNAADSSEDVNIWDEPDTGNIIYAESKEDLASSPNTAPGVGSSSSASGASTAPLSSSSTFVPAPLLSSLSSPNLSTLTSSGSLSSVSVVGNSAVTVPSSSNPSPEEKIRSLKAASINKLVVMLTPENFHDIEYLKTFLLTYQSFTTPEKLLQKLIQRYHVPQRAGQTDEEWRKVSLPIQLRVVNVIKTWIKDYRSDFNDKLIANVKSFIDNSLRVDNNMVYVKTLTQALNNKLRPEEDEENRKRTFNEPPPEPKVPKNIFSPSLDLFDVDEEEIARQMTLIDFEIYSSIKPSELLNQSWNKPKLRHRSPNVLRTITRFNEVSHWVTSSILRVERIRDRSRIMAKFIRIAEFLMRPLNNFNSSMAILAGITAASVHRLKFTREEIPKHAQAVLQDLQTQLSSNQSYKEYRQLLSRANPPCIPYLGVYLTDLTFIEEGNRDLYQNLINFSKRKLIYNVIAKVKQYQLSAYNLQPVYQIAALLWKPNKGMPFMSEDEQFRLSLIREPRGKERTEIL